MSGRSGVYAAWALGLVAVSAAAFVIGRSARSDDPAAPSSSVPVISDGAKAPRISAPQRVDTLPPLREAPPEPVEIIDNGGASDTPSSDFGGGGSSAPITPQAPTQTPTQPPADPPIDGGGGGLTPGSGETE